jgi:hypothetical protein
MLEKIREARDNLRRVQHRISDEHARKNMATSCECDICHECPKCKDENATMLAHAAEKTLHRGFDDYREAIAYALKVTAKNRGEFKPYLAYSYAGQGWVEVLSEPQGQPPRRLCKWPTCDATFLVPDSLLQGAPATGD